MPTYAPSAGHTPPPLVAALRQRLGSAVNRARRALTPYELRRYDRLHLGAGWRHMPGWGNIDLHGRRNLIWDLTRPLPLPRRSVKFVYSEHFIEHVPRPSAVLLLTNARRALAEDGVVRLSTPDLRFWATTYLAGEVIQHEHSGWFPRTPCEMLNDQMRLWGHQMLYDEAELTRVLREAGFSRIERVARGESRHAALRGIESRPASGDLILEAQI